MPSHLLKSPADMRLFNTLTREIQSVIPEDGANLRFYCCGPTVYGSAYMGNFRTFVLQDVFRRVVEATAQETCHVRNLTDVDDKTIHRSQTEGRSLGEADRRGFARVLIALGSALEKPHFMAPSSTSWRWIPSAAHGNSFFEFDVDGESLRFEARFSLMMDLASPRRILLHHSCQFLLALD